MNRELPEDMAEWPHDAAELLGVGPDADTKELKRAYARLIRRFKPEQFPEQFRRIREAYEALMERQRFFEQFRPFLPQPVEPPADEQAVVDSVPIPAPVIADAVADAWAMATSGNLHAAYREFERLVPGEHGRDAAVRLYWLLRVAPELAPNRQPVEWLCLAFEHDPEGIAAELLRRELESNYPAAWHPAVERLLDTTRSSDRLADLVSWRWRAAGLALKPWVIIEDAPRLRPRLHASGLPWVRLLMQAADVLAWVDPHEDMPARWCYQEIEELATVSPETDYLFDRFDNLRVLTAEWLHMIRAAEWLLDAVESAPVNWTQWVLRLIPRIWLAPNDLLRPDLYALAAAIADDPVGWLRHFDRLVVNGPGVVALLFSALRNLAEEDNAAEMEPSVAPLPATLQSPEFWDEYAASREGFLEYCIDAGASPIDEAMRVTETGVTRHDGAAPITIVMSDIALCSVFTAVRCIRG